MKAGIHPKYYPEAKVSCSCGNNWTVGATLPAIRTDVCHACHPFFTGEQRIVDTEGQVDRFYQRLEKREQIKAQLETHRQTIASGNVPIADLGLSSRTLGILQVQGLKTVSEVIAQLAEGDEALLEIRGFGQKSLIDVKKRLRASGYMD